MVWNGFDEGPLVIFGRIGYSSDMKIFKKFLAGFLLVQAFCLTQFALTTDYSKEKAAHCPVEHCLAHGDQETPVFNSSCSADPVDKPNLFEDAAISYLEPKDLLSSSQEYSSFLIQTRNIVLRL